MGTYANIVIVTADSVASLPAAHHAATELARIDSLMSNWTTTSEVARVNRVAASAPTALQPEVATVIDTSLRVWRESDGAFDITVEPLIRAWGFLGGPRRVRLRRGRPPPRSSASALSACTTPPPRVRSVSTTPGFRSTWAGSPRATPSTWPRARCARPA